MPGNAESGANDVDLVEREGYLEARLKGAYTLERFKRQIAFTLQACKERGAKRLLADVFGLTGFESITTLDRFEIGSHAADLGKHLEAVAMLGSPIQFDPEQFGVQVAKNRGMNVQVFWDRKAAADWLAGFGAEPRG